MRNDYKVRTDQGRNTYLRTYLLLLHLLDNQWYSQTLLTTNLGPDSRDLDLRICTVRKLKGKIAQQNRHNCLKGSQKGSGETNL